MSALLAVDGGQSGLRMTVAAGERVGAVAEVAGYSHGDGEGVAGVAKAVAQARRGLALCEPVARVCLGLTGAPRPPELKDRLGALISSELDGAEVWFGPDMLTAHAGALHGEPGVVVAAGTGAVVFGLGPDGTSVRADGLGYLLGDDGSGFAIGRAGIRAALAAREGRGPATALLNAAIAFFGDLDELPHRVYTSSAPVRELAGFTPSVAAVARRGDEVARAIWAQAAWHLVTTTAAVVERTFPGASEVAVSHAGRLFGVEDLLLEPFVAGLRERCPAARHRAPLGDSLTGAAHLVVHGLGAYAPLMHATAGARA
jgi:N-acetylglucosamine kinase-like BadF-type ATPase